MKNKVFWTILAALIFATLVACLTPSKAASITNVQVLIMGTSTNILTNVWTTAGNSQTQIVVQTQSVISNLTTGVLTTNTDTTVVANIPYWPNAQGWVYGSTNGQIAFLGANPISQQFITNWPATQVSTELSNITAWLRLIGLTRTN
jgi:hypothetical protein